MEGAITLDPSAPSTPLEFRDVERAKGLVRALESAVDRALEKSGRECVSVMHVCGSHEQAIARYGLRSSFPERYILAG